MKVNKDLFSGITAGTKGITIEMIAEPKMNKRGNPFIGRVLKHTTFISPYLGCNYGSMVTREGQRQGVNDTFNPDTIKWANNVNAYFIEHKTSGDYYLKVGLKPDTIVKSSYLVDGREATAEEVEQIQSFMPAPSDSKKQSEYGIEAERQVKWRTINMENVVSVRQGTTTYYER